MSEASASRRVSRGVTLIELMIALLIGTLLVLGLVQIFAASRGAYQLSQGVARNQESSRFAVDFLTRDLRMAGHTGCVNDQSLLSGTATTITGGNVRSLFLTGPQRDANNVAALPFPLRFDVSIQGFEARGTAPGDTITLAAVPAVGAAGDWNPALPAQIAALGPVAGSDIVVLRYFSAEESPISDFNAAGIITYPAAGSALMTGGNGLYGIADCRSATVFQASAAPTTTQVSVTQTGLNASNLSYVSAQDSSLAYRAGGASLYRAESIVFYVGVNLAGDPALFRARLTTTPGSGAAPAYVADEMVEGVESVQLLYGLDSETNLSAPPIGYIATSVTAAAIGDVSQAARWRRVGAVQLGLMIRNTGDGAASLQATQPSAVLQVRMNTPQDGQYRATYVTSIALRNRLYGN